MTSPNSASLGDAPESQRNLKRTLKSVARYWPLFVLACLGAAVYSLGLQRHLTLAWVTEQQNVFRGTIAAHPVLAPLAYIGLYTATVACAIPGGVVMGVAAGFLFGTLLGGTYALVAITIGATLLFLAARAALRPALERRAGRLLQKLTPALEANGFSYLLAVRFIPLT